MVRETSSRDRYRKLKREITAKLTYDRFVLPAAGAGGKTYRTALTKTALLPLTVVALPTICESTDASKRTLQSEPQSPRSTTSPVAPSRLGRAVCPASSLRPCLAALPMRSWNSDDSNFLASGGTGSDVMYKSGAVKRARLSRSGRVDVVAPSSMIPIIISSPDDGDKQLVTSGKPVELVSAARRLSCPFPVYDVTVSTSSCAERELSTSRKRRHDFAQSHTSQRRPSLQFHDESCQPVSGAARGHVDSKYQSSLDVDWSSARRLSLPSDTDNRSRLQLLSAASP